MVAGTGGRFCVGWAERGEPWGAGVDWEAVQRYVNMGFRLQAFQDPQSCGGKPSRLVRLLALLFWCFHHPAAPAAREGDGPDVETG